LSAFSNGAWAPRIGPAGRPEDDGVDIKGRRELLVGNVSVARGVTFAPFSV
jgi:hypothetical protein